MSPHGKPVHEKMMEGRWQKDKEKSKVSTSHTLASVHDQPHGAARG